MSMKSTLLAAGFAVAAMTGASGIASAHYGHGHFFFGHPGVRLYVGPPSYDCSYYLAKWEDTGSFYWKRRYYACKGWW